MKKKSGNILKIFFYTIFFGFFWVEITFASNFTLTGENKNIKFSEQNTLTINTVAKKISGKIFLKETEEIITIPETSIHCGNNWMCTWINGRLNSHMIWNLEAPIIIFDTNNLSISGNFSTFMGTFSLENISLTNNSIYIENISNINSNTTELRLANAKSDFIYELEIFFNNQSLQKITAQENIFKNIDFSLAGNYRFILKETRKWTSESNIIFDIQNISVKPGEIAAIIKNWDFFAKRFCQNNFKNILTCPDKQERKWSHINMDENIFAPGKKNITIELRDEYGNRIDSKTIFIEIKNLSKTSDLLDYSIFSPVEIEPTSQREQNENTFRINLPSNNYTFSVKSFVPTHQNILQISKIFYDTKDITNIFNQREIIFQEPWTLESINIPNILYDQIDTNFNVSIKRHNNSPVPTIIGKISTNLELTSNPGCYITASQTQNTELNCPNLINIDHSIFGFRGDTKNISIRPNISSNEESAKIELFAQYTSDFKIFSYKIGEKNITIKKPKSEDITINNGISNTPINNLWNTSSITAKNTRTWLLNLIKKNIAYLKRNSNNNFTTKNYTITENNSINLNAPLNPNIRTYITIGGDITIHQNIPKSHTPIAIIALDNNGNGGNIKISGDVTNIHATLIAENSITSIDTNSKNQLAIIGSILANNICKDSYEHCLANLRKDFDFKDTTGTSKKAIGFENNPNKIIIQYDPIIRSNPPPALENFME